MGHEEVRVRNTLEIRYFNDDHFVVLVNGDVIFDAFHDDIGRDGMIAVEDTALGIARQTDMKVIRT